MTDSSILSQDSGTELEFPLTVAMAVYNADRYLKPAIENILSQTYCKYELLIIDDGSTDNSINIIKGFADKDKRIRYILKSQNEGLSSVRNLSIKEARGKYLMMIDADDLFEPDAIAKAMNTALCNKADVVIWDYDTFCSGELPPAKVPSALNEIEASDRHALLYLPAFMPIRLIRTEYARSRKLEFPNGLTKQDIPVHWNIVTDSEAVIALLPERLFHYRQHPQATSSRKGKSLFSLAYVMDIVVQDLKKKNLYNEFKNDYYKKQLTLLHGMYDFISPENKDEAMKMINDRLNDDAQKYLSERIGDLPSRSQLFYRAINGSILAKISYQLFLSIRNIKRAIR